MLWRMLVLEFWHRNFVESRSRWNEPRRAPEIRNSEVPMPVSPPEAASGAGVRAG
jgi:hypothetical protein